MRVLFVPNLGTVDASEVDKVKADLNSEMKKKEHYKKELMRVKVEYQQLQARYHLMSQRCNELSNLLR